MSDIVAQLEVLSRESGCLIDISAILNLSICPKVEVITDKPHVVEEKDDVVCITPTPPTKPPTLPPTIPTKVGATWDTSLFRHSLTRDPAPCQQEAMQQADLLRGS